MRWTTLQTGLGKRNIHRTDVMTIPWTYPSLSLIPHRHNGTRMTKGKKVELRDGDWISPVVELSSAPDAVKLVSKLDKFDTLAFFIFRAARTPLDASPRHDGAPLVMAATATADPSAGAPNDLAPPLAPASLEKQSWSAPAMSSTAEDSCATVAAAFAQPITVHSRRDHHAPLGETSIGPTTPTATSAASPSAEAAATADAAPPPTPPPPPTAAKHFTSTAGIIAPAVLPPVTAGAIKSEFDFDADEMAPSPRRMRASSNTAMASREGAQRGITMKVSSAQKASTAPRRWQAEYPEQSTKSSRVCGQSGCGGKRPRDAAEEGQEADAGEEVGWRTKTDRTATELSLRHKERAAEHVRASEGADELVGDEAPPLTAPRPSIKAERKPAAGITIGGLVRAAIGHKRSRGQSDGAASRKRTEPAEPTGQLGMPGMPLTNTSIHDVLGHMIRGQASAWAAAD